MKVAIDRAIPYIDGVLEPWGKVRYCAAIGRAEAEWADALVVRTRTRCDEELLKGTNVRLVASATAGYDHIDTDYCRRAGIEAVWAPGCNARGVLQWVAAALANWAEGRDGTVADGGVRGCDGSATNGGVRRSDGERLTLGVVGVGAVGSLVAEYADMWGFNVLLCDPPRERELMERSTPPAAKTERSECRPPRGAAACDVSGSAPDTCGSLRSPHNKFISLEEIAEQADIITFHTPLDETTFHMADEQFFAALKPNSLILNASRGEVVDQRALLQSGHPYCIDTWEDEPRIDRELLAKALIATPHIAGYTIQGKANATAAVVRAVARHFGLSLKTESPPFASSAQIFLNNWYPAGIAPSSPHPISWNEMRSQMPAFFDIVTQTRALKTSPQNFENLRNNYKYREEYF